MKVNKIFASDLLARIPYGVVVDDRNGTHELTIGNTELVDLLSGKCHIRPYLRTMDSMTEEELKEYRSIQSDIWKPCGTQYYDNRRSIRWLYEHHFNVNLPEDLFIKVTEENNPYNQ